jgi:hypothetical protein
MSSIEDRLNAVIRSGGTSTPAPAQTTKKAAPNSISERLDKVIASGKGQPSVYKAPASTTKASTSKNQWVSTGGGRKSTTGAGKNNKSSAPKKSFFEIATQNKAPGRVAGNAQPRQTSYAGQLGQVSRNAAAPNSRYDAGGLRTAQKKEVAAPSIGKDRSNQYSLRKGLESVVLKGGQQVAQAAGNTAALAEDLVLAPFELFSGQELGSLSDNAPFNTWARGIQREGQELQDKYAGNVAKGGKAAELLDRYGASTVAAVPQAVLAMLTSGGSMAASTAGLSSTAASELAPGVASTIRRSITAAAKDPQYWLSFGQVVGDGYESALQDMQASGKYDNNTARTKAALYAIGNGILNAEVEVGGGIQKLPDELKHGAAAWRAWVNSMVDEGKEEVVQDVIERAMQNSVYGKGNPLASLSDPNAILNPRTAAEEFAGGAIVGGVLGAGQIGAQKVLESRSNRATPQQPTQQAPGAQADVQEDTYTPTPANAAEGAQNAAPGVETAPKYDALQADAIRHEGKTFRNLVAGFDTSVSEFFNKWRNGRKNTETEKLEKLYLGKMSEDAKRQASNILGYEIDSRDMIVTSDDVKHILDSHGNAETELQRGNQPLEQWAIDAIPDVVTQPDSIVPGSTNTSGKHPGKQGVIFSKTMPNGTVVTVQFDNKGRKTMELTTMYVKKSGPTTQAFNVENTSPQLTAKPVPESVSSASSELSPVTNADVGPAPTASVVETTPVEGTRPLNANDSIAQGAEIVKNGGAAEFDTPGDAVAGAVNTPFDTMQARSEGFYPVNPNSAQRIQAEQRRAPSEVPVVNPDTGRNVEKTVSTILNSPLTSPEMATVYENAISGGAFDYDVVTDRGAVQQAQAKIARDGWREVANSFVAKAELGQRITKADTAEAISAYNLAISEGDHKAAFELATAIANAAHDSAQMVQAMNLMNRLTPEGRLLTLRRLVDRMNDRAARQNRTPRQSIADSGDVEGARVDYIDKVTGFTLSDELATNYLMAETDAERAAAWDAITTSIADQIPSTFMEKANFWRYTSMLTNPTTHIRNIMGNAIQMGARKIKNGIGTAIERAVIKDQSQRTKAVNVGKDLKAFAKGQYETDQSAAMGSGKYSDATTAGIEREIQSKRKMFKGEDILSRSVQGIGDLNSRALDYEDVIFNRAAYVDSFAQALQAKGVTAAEAHAGTRAADVEAARAYAIEEAQKATYRNTTALSEALSKMGRYQGDNQVLRAASFAADAFLPFRKTPANILTTGLDYSPIGLGRGIKEAMFDVKSGKCTAADAVDSIASGLTGTGILALGAYLAAEGFFGATLHVRAGDDDKEEAFEKSMGGQDYAIQIGDKSYTLDWAVPAAMPLFAGAAIMESVRKGGGTFDALVDSLLGMQDVVLETSMLSSLNDLISYWSYADNKVGYLLDRAASSYAGQYIPTIGSKVASVFDDTVRKSYVEKGTGQLSSDVNYFLQGAAKKVPGARNQLQPSIDLWGNEVSNGSAPERVVQSFISPGFLKAQDNSPATQEIRRLAKATGDSTVYPAAAEKSYTVKGETRTLTGEEYTRYAKTMGQARKKLVEAAVKLPAYKSMSNSEKADYIQNVYKYARETARQQVDPKYEPSAKWIENAKTSKRDIGVSTEGFLALYQQYGSEKMSGKAYEKVKLAYQAGISPETYFGLKASADTDGNGRVSKAEASAALAGQENRADLWSLLCTTGAKNPYK